MGEAKTDALESPPLAPLSTASLPTEQNGLSPEDVDLHKTMEELDDPGFSLYVFPPNCTAQSDRILLEHVTAADTVLSLRQLVAEYPQVAAYTCYHLEAEINKDGKQQCVPLNDFVELGEYPDIVDQVEIKMILEKYDARKARQHVGRFRELLVNPPIPQSVLAESSQAAMGKKTRTNSMRSSRDGKLSTKKKKGTSKSEDGNDTKSLTTSSSSNPDQKECLVGGNGKPDLPGKVPPVSDKVYSALDQIQIPVPNNLGDYYTMTTTGDDLKESKLNALGQGNGGSGSTVELPTCIRSIVFSGFNPPPASRKLTGDLLYLEIQVEGEESVLHVTSHVDGFFINRSSQGHFNPHVHEAHGHQDHLLLNVLRNASSVFETSYQSVLSRASMLAKEGPASIQWMIAAGNDIGGKLPWITPSNGSSESHKYDKNRAEDELCASYGMEERGILRDWNEEYQCCRELPATTLKEKIVRARVMYKIVTEFVEAATQGAMAIVEGHIPPINPMDEPNAHVYVFNNIFFSLPVDGKSSGKDATNQNDEGGYSAANRDLQGVKALNEADIAGLYTLATAVVDYLGIRVIAQSLIPGILQGEAASKLIYGSVDGGKTIAFNPKMHDLMLKASTKLHLAEREIQPLGPESPETGSDQTSKAKSSSNNENEEINKGQAGTDIVKLCGPVEAKGILGSDGRMYALDLVRITPKDSTYYEPQPLSNENADGLHFQREDETYVALLRPELINLYVLWRRNQIRRANRDANNKSKELNSKASDNNNTLKKQIENSEEAPTENADEPALKPEKVPSTSESTKDVSLVSTKEDESAPIQFNPNVFMKYDACVDKEQVARDESLARDAADYLQRVVLPAFVADLRRGSISPADGYSLAELMHSCGINMRYLGRLASLIAKSEDSPTNNTAYLSELLEAEMVARATKHLLGNILTSNPDVRAALGQALLCILNGIFGGCMDAHSNTIDQSEELKLTQAQKNTGSSQTNPAAYANGVGKHPSGQSAQQLDPSSVWTKLKTHIKKSFDYELFIWGSHSNAKVSKRVYPHVLLRRICQRTGLRVCSRDYDFTIDAPFTIADITGVVPIVKDSLPNHPLPLAKQLLERGRFYLSTGSLASAYELLQEASALLFQVCGAAHEDAALCSSSLATVLYHAGDVAGAIAQQQRALVLYTQLNGVDYHDTVFAHANLALFLHANNQSDLAALHMRRSIYLLELCAGANSPELGSLYFKLGMICQDAGHLTLALECHQESLRRGNLDSLQSATTYHQMALACALMGDFREALVHEKKVYSIYKEIFGEKDTHTLDSAKYMTRFTEKAVEGAKGRREVDAAAAADAIANQLLQELEQGATTSKKKKSKKGKQAATKC
uniref:Eukaryotic translation initiation factor 3 subunit p n=1 Tax=Albugo laibachii Nc14 TaxID=890382 RepID=F0W176_9STRA|nr:eukaryotic translation initiation factor 3 subunit p [Albugo laibachii Nc14]|eukprot:CCA14802.1 eukaryotic translation initiation factor 3 subunit p [Albugo laibachii Nc14]